jgi:hypothetical protein
MSNPYRNALAELVRRWYAASGDQDLLDVADAMDHARTLLAQPELPELTDEEIDDWCGETVTFTTSVDAGV